MRSTHKKGIIAELKVQEYCIRHGYEVYTPLSPFSSVDLIVLRKCKLERLQVKYVNHEERTAVKFFSNGKKYSHEIFDWIATYNRATDQCYFVHISEIPIGAAGITLRMTKTKNGQKKHVRKAKNYLDW